MSSTSKAQYLVPAAPGPKEGPGHPTYQNCETTKYRKPNTVLAPSNRMAIETR
jgi:hypothetical protein